MRRLAALLVTTIATVAVLTFGLANPAQAAWQEYTHYPDLASCEAAGQDGVNNNQWELYYCHYVWGDWLLWVYYPD